jgi:hypothetical protein
MQMAGSTLVPVAGLQTRCEKNEKKFSWGLAKSLGLEYI